MKTIVSFSLLMLILLTPHRGYAWSYVTAGSTATSGSATVYVEDWTMGMAIDLTLSRPIPSQFEINNNFDVTTGFPTLPPGPGLWFGEGYNYRTNGATSWSSPYYQEMKVLVVEKWLWDTNSVYTKGGYVDGPSDSGWLFGWYCHYSVNQHQTCNKFRQMGGWDNIYSAYHYSRDTDTFVTSSGPTKQT